MGNETKFTPGPWEIVRSGGGWVREITDSDGRAVCYGSIDDGNARLIAAAPELIEALKGVVEIIDAAGLGDLTRGVHLDPVVWHVKASNALNYARAKLAQAGAPDPREPVDSER